MTVSWNFPFALAIRIAAAILFASVVIGCFTPGRIQGFDYSAQPAAAPLPTARPPITGPRNPYQPLAEKFAPVVYYAGDEPNLPANVDWYLKNTDLWFYDAKSGMRLPIKHAPTETDLHWGQDGIHQANRSDYFQVDSCNWRDPTKTRTFFLATVDRPLRAGIKDSSQWTTYYHAYPNTSNGVTIQYWRFYAFNSGFLGVGDHGGDWECAQIVLGQNAVPLKLRLLGHKTIQEVAWDKVTCEDQTHPQIFAERGGHTSCIQRPPTSLSNMIRQESKNYGIVSWPDGRKTPNGLLVNMGEKRQPLNGCDFVSYSGLWGSPNTFWFNSGYWGPAFNETGMTGDVCVAWCGDMNGALTEDSTTKGP